MMQMFNSAVLATALILSGVGGGANAQGNSESCHLRAKQESGFRGVRPVVGSFGNLNLRFSGSAAVGVTRDSRPDLTQPAPPFAGSAARERREKKALDLYMQSYERCMLGG